MCVRLPWKYDIFGASPPWIERGCSLRATERRGLGRSSRLFFFIIFFFSFFFDQVRGELSSGPQCDEEIVRWIPLLRLTFSFLRFLPAVAKVSVGSCAGILSSAILFSPRFLLPGQMHTNAFRSSTDKEWTRFRGSNVSQRFLVERAICVIAIYWLLETWTDIRKAVNCAVIPWNPWRQSVEQDACSYSFCCQIVTDKRFDSVYSAKVPSWCLASSLLLFLGESFSLPRNCWRLYKKIS